MTNPSTLDEIQARHDLLDASYKGACSCCNPPKSHTDRGKLVAALRAVEAVADKYSAVFETEEQAHNTALAGILDDLEIKIREVLA